MDLTVIRENDPYTVLTLHIPLNLHSTSYGTLPAGTYRHVGDLRPCLTDERDQGAVAAGLLQLKYVSAEKPAERPWAPPAQSFSVLQTSISSATAALEKLEAAEDDREEVVITDDEPTDKKDVSDADDGTP